jgi:hypothetical protein
MIPMTQPLPQPSSAMVSANAIVSTSNESVRQRNVIERLERKLEFLMSRRGMQLTDEELDDYVM